MIMDEKQNWEYRVENLGNAWKNPKPDEMTAELNQWGLEGWEVIGISHTPGGSITVIAKRMLGSSERRNRSVFNYT
jgi:hypothetical protein